MGIRSLISYEGKNAEQTDTFKKCKEVLLKSGRQMEKEAKTAIPMIQKERKQMGKEICQGRRQMGKKSQRNP